MDQVPIANLIRIAFYAGDFLAEGDDIEITHEQGETFDLLLRGFLARAAERIRARGFERGYSTAEALDARPHGRMLVVETIARGAHGTGRVWCRYDEFDSDTPRNRVLKACARILSRGDDSDQYRDALRALVREMRSVTDQPISRQVLRSIPKSDADRRYGVVRFIARVLIDAGQPDANIGPEWARQLLRDERKMRRVFERFVFRLLRSRSPAWASVCRERYQWSRTAQPRMPTLETDVAIHRPGRTRIIECKYTPNIMAASRYAGPSYQPEHLRQLFAYLSRAEKKSVPTTAIEGVLLYPALGTPHAETVLLDEFRCQICSISLAEEWSSICARLLSLGFDDW